MDPCDTLDGIQGRSATYFDASSDNGAAFDTGPLRDALRAFTTKVASEKLYADGEDRHFECAANMHRELSRAGLGDCFVKGGLALHMALRSQLDELARCSRAHAGRSSIKQFKDTVLERYVRPSDLDVGVHVHALFDEDTWEARTDQDAQDALQDAIDVCEKQVNEMRTAWHDATSVAEDIARACTAAVDSAFLADIGVAAVRFEAEPSADQVIERVTDADDPECPFTECAKVSTQSNGTHAIFVSKNSGLSFAKGDEWVDFLLVRAKWGIVAVVTRLDGSECRSVCSAELIDVAIQRPRDSRFTTDRGHGMHVMLRSERVGRITVPAAALRFHELDLRLIMKDMEKAIDDSVYRAASDDDAREVILLHDAKAAKRIARYATLAVLRNLKHGLYGRTPSFRRDGTIADIVWPSGVREQDQFLATVLQLFEDDLHDLKTTLPAFVQAVAKTTLTGGADWPLVSRPIAEPNLDGVYGGAGQWSAIGPSTWICLGVTMTLALVSR